MFKFRSGKSWAVTVRGRSHSVHVKRKPWLAIGIVEVDGERVGMFPAKSFSLGLFVPHPEVYFDLSGVSCVVKVQPGMIGYNYDLYVGDKLVEPEEPGVV